MATLKDVNPRVLEEVAKTLGRIGDARAVEPLVATLKDVDPRVLEEVAKTLGRIGDARAAAPLVGLIAHKHYRVWTAVTDALALVNPGWPKSHAAQQMIPGLVAALQDSDPKARQAAMRALSAIGGPEAEAALRGHSEAHQERNGRRVSRKLLGYFWAPPLIHPRPQIDQGVRVSVTRHVRFTNQRFVEIRSALRHPARRPSSWPGPCPGVYSMTRGHRQ